MAETAVAMVDPMQQTAPQPESGGRSLADLKGDYHEYLDLKRAEIDEQQNSRRYYHSSQWTAKQIKAFNARKQPVVTYNRVARKINAVVGLLERQRQDPRGFARTPQHEHGAEVSTAVVRYVLDQQRWPEKSPIVGLNGAIDGIGGIELLLEAGDRGDPEIGFDIVDQGGFFYDPTSTRADFSDASYMGIGKWASQADVIAAFPDKEDLIRAGDESGADLTSDPDSDKKWIAGTEKNRRIRLVDLWYRVGEKWFWAIFVGSGILAEGRSPFKDEKRRDSCKYIMFSANVDHDGDRYGFVRNMKSSQDEINQRRSKGLHILNSRRMVVRDGEGLDVEAIRREAVRPDGVIVVPPGAEAPEFDDGQKAAELNGHIGMLREAKEEIENYGFNPALMGTGVQSMSGRAIALQQQAGIAELGPYLLGFKGWKLRVYRAIWSAVQQHWTSERWIRVTDDEELSNWLAINRLEFDPQTGAPTIANALGSLDVDIILDEGPDTINVQADTNESVREVLRSVGPILTPAAAQAALEVLIDTSQMPSSAKQKFRQASRQQAEPDPQQQQIQQRAVQIKMAGEMADVEKTRAETDLAEARAMESRAKAGATEMDSKLAVVDRLTPPTPPAPPQPDPGPTVWL